MKRYAIAAAVVVALAGCAQMQRMTGMDWETLVDGDKGLDNFSRVGDANWRAEDGAIVADAGKGGHLVSNKSYGDFEMRAEFWAATDTNSGIFIRCNDRAKISAANCYEVNIWDIRPEPKYGTGASWFFSLPSGASRIRSCSAARRIRGVQHREKTKLNMKAAPYLIIGFAFG